jgi:pimeloyl-ACP methyl ester carboxylesterase
MLVLGAERDILVPPSDVEQAARAYGTAAEIFPGMGHVMMLEAGWQKVADRIIEWTRALRLDPVR